MILTKPSSITKNSPATFTINKDELVAHPIVIASLLSNKDVWAKIVVSYRSSVGNDMKKIVFNATQTNPTKEFFASEFAQDIFQVQGLTIYNHDGGNVRIKRSDLITLEFDVTLVEEETVIEYPVIPSPEEVTMNRITAELAEVAWTPVEGNTEGYRVRVKDSESFVLALDDTFPVDASPIEVNVLSNRSYFAEVSSLYKTGPNTTEFSPVIESNTIEAIPEEVVPFSLNNQASWMPVGDFKGVPDKLNVTIALDENKENMFVFPDTTSTLVGDFRAQVSGLTIKMEDGAIDSVISDILSEPFISCFCTSEDGSTLYVVGTFSQKYLETNLPIESHNAYVKLLKIDATTGAVELLNNNLAQVPVNMAEASGVVAIAYNGILKGYSSTNGSELWQKLFDNSGIVSKKVIASNGSIYITAKTYNSVVHSKNPSSRPIIYKIDPNTGNSDNTFLTETVPVNAFTPTAMGISSSGVGVLLGAGHSRIFKNGAVTQLSNMSGSTPVGVFVTDTEIHIAYDDSNVRTHNILGEYIKSISVASYFPELGNYQFVDLVADESFFYILRRSANTLKTSHQAIIKISKDGSQQFGYTCEVNVGYMFDSMVKIPNSNRISLLSLNRSPSKSVPDPMYAKRTASSDGKALKINLLTKQVVSSSDLPLPINAGSWKHMLRPVTSSLRSDVIFLKKPSGELGVMNCNTMQFETGWPTTGEVKSIATDGQYVYVATNTAIASDSGGAWNKKLVRINVTTKMLDRTFDPTSLYGAVGDNTLISATPDYLYLSMSRSNNPPLTYRMLKTTKAVTVVSASNVNTAVHNTTYAPVMTFNYIGNGKIAVCAVPLNHEEYGSVGALNNNSGLGGEKNYTPVVVLNEGDLSKVGHVPVNHRIVDIPLFNPVTCKMTTRAYLDGDMIIAEYNTLDLTSEVLLENMSGVGGVGSRPRESIQSLKHFTNIVSSGGTVYMPMWGWIDHKYTYGIVKFDPLPVLKVN